MNFNLLTENLVSTDALREKRVRIAASEYAKALDLSQLYFSEPDPQLLKQALGHLDQVLRHQATHADAYYLMAYLFYLLDMLPQALKYLRSCLGFVPAHTQALRLQKVLAAGHFPEPEVVGRSPGPEEWDSEALFDSLLREIQQANLKTMQMQVPLYPDPTPATIMLLRGFEQELITSLALFAKQITQLEAELDTFSLQRSLLPLEKRLEQVRRLIHQSKRLSDLLSQLKAEAEQVQACFAKPASAELDKILDRCDWLADRLDELEAQKIPITSVLADYRQLVKTVEVLQDLYDENIH